MLQVVACCGGDTLGERWVLVGTDRLDQMAQQQNGDTSGDAYDEKDDAAVEPRGHNNTVPMEVPVVYPPHAVFKDTVSKTVSNPLAGQHRRDFKKAFDKSKLVVPGTFYSIDQDVEAMMVLLGQLSEKSYASYHQAVRNIDSVGVIQQQQQYSSNATTTAVDSRTITALQQELEDANASTRRYRCEKKLLGDMYSSYMYLVDRMHTLATTVVNQWRQSGAAATSELEQLAVFLRQNMPVSAATDADDHRPSRDDLEHHLSMIPHLADVLEDYQSIQEQLLKMNKKYKAVKSELVSLKRTGGGISRPGEGPPVDFGGGCSSSSNPLLGGGPAGGTASSAGGKRKKHH